jgi:hypothetical protein
MEQYPHIPYISVRTSPEYNDEFGSSDIYGWASEHFTEFYLQNDVLQKVNRASMANGLEVTSPILDNKVVDVLQ